MDLTLRQAEVLQHVHSQQEKYGIVPTVRGICDYCGTGFSAPLGFDLQIVLLFGLFGGVLIGLKID